jgi:hypothetical protein
MKTEPAEPLSSEPPDFSLILGGPLFQLLRRAHPCGDVAELVWRRMIALALITWLPLLVLSIVEGHAWGDSVKVPFLLDVDVHARSCSRFHCSSWRNWWSTSGCASSWERL